MRRAQRHKTGSVVLDRRRKTWNFLSWENGRSHTSRLGTLKDYPKHKMQLGVQRRRFGRTEAYDSLALSDIKRFSSTGQASEECCEGLDQAQECSPIIGLVSDRLQLHTEHLFTLAQRRHALPQLFDRQESFLVGDGTLNH